MNKLKRILSFAIVLVFSFMISLALNSCGQKQSNETDDTEKPAADTTETNESEHPTSEHPSGDSENETPEEEHPSDDEEEQDSIQ